MCSNRIPILLVQEATPTPAYLRSTFRIVLTIAHDSDNIWLARKFPKDKEARSYPWFYQHYGSCGGILEVLTLTLT